MTPNDPKDATTDATSISDIVSLDDHRVGVIGNYPKTLREIAFEIWFNYCDRNLARTHRYLEADPNWRMVIGVPDDTPVPSAEVIKKWKQRDNWDQKLVDTLRSTAPWSMGAAAVKLASAMNRSADVVAELVENATNDDATKLKAAMFVLEPVREGLTALLQPSTGMTGDIGDLSGLSMSELAEKERQVIAKKVV